MSYFSNTSFARTSINRFLPSDISGLKLWLDADDLATITKDGSDLVSQWDDKSGEGNDVSQATGSKQPLWVDSVQNGRPIIRFDAVDDFLNRTTFVNGALSQTNTIFIVAKMPPNSTNDNGVVFDGETSRHLFLHLGVAGVSDYFIFAGTNLTATTTVDSTNILLYTLVFNSSSSSLRKSKTGILSGDAGTGTFNGVTLGAPTTLTDSFSDPDIAEMLVYNAALSTADRDTVEDHLTTKWGV